MILRAAAINIYKQQSSHKSKTFLSKTLRDQGASHHLIEDFSSKTVKERDMG